MTNIEKNDEYFRKKYPALYEQFKGTPAWDKLIQRDWKLDGKKESGKTESGTDLDARLQAMVERWNKSPSHAASSARYQAFVERYAKNPSAIPIDRTQMHEVTSELYDGLWSDCPSARWLNKLATVCSILILPALLLLSVGPFFWGRSAAVIGVALALMFWVLAAQLQARAVRVLAIQNETAFQFLRLGGIIVPPSGNEVPTNLNQ